MRRFIIEMGCYSLDVTTEDDVDLGERFKAVCNDTGETLLINGWLIESEEELTKMADYSTEAVELYNFAVNERELHARRQSAVDFASGVRPHHSLSAMYALDIIRSAVNRYSGECFTTEHILEAALMLHREDMKAVAEDRAAGGKGEL